MKTILFATIMLAACIAAKAQFTQPGQKLLEVLLGLTLVIIYLLANPVMRVRETIFL